MVRGTTSDFKICSCVSKEAMYGFETGHTGLGMDDNAKSWSKTGSAFMFPKGDNESDNPNTGVCSGEV